MKGGREVRRSQEGKRAEFVLFPCSKPSESNDMYQYHIFQRPAGVRSRACSTKALDDIPETIRDLMRPGFKDHLEFRGPLSAYSCRLLTATM